MPSEIENVVYSVCSQLEDEMMLKRLVCFNVVLLIFVKSISCYNESVFSNNYEDQNIEATAQCVLKLSAKYLVDKKALRGNIVIINIDTYASLATQTILTTIHHGKKYSIMIKDSAFKHKNASHFPEKAKNYLMILDKKEELIRNINQLKVLPTWNPLAKAVIYIKKREDANAEDLVKELVDELLKYQLLRVVILVDLEENDNMMAYHCRPYSKTNCAGPCDKVDLLDICTSDHITHVDNYTDIIPENMENCPLTVYAAVSEPYVMPPNNKVARPIYVDQYNFTSGVEVKLLQMITDITNMSLIIRMMNNFEERGELFSNGTATGLYEKVRNNIVDIIIGNLEVNKDIRKWLDVSSFYTQDEITWCLQSAGTTSTWSNLITIFTLSTWLTTLAAIILATFLFQWFLLQEEPNKSFWPTRPFLSSFGMVLGMVMHIDPKGTAFRILVMTWLLFSLNLNTSYQSVLRSFLIHPKYDYQISTEAELISQDLKFGGKPWIRETYKDNAAIYDKFKLCPSLNECVKEVQTNAKFAIAVPNKQMQYQEKFIGTDEFTYCFDENNIIYKYGVVLLSRKFFPLLTKFNRIIKSVNENGLIGKWINEAMPRDKKKSKSEMFPLGMTHMIGAFYVIFIGGGIAGLVLLIEIIVHKCVTVIRRRKRSKIVNNAN